MHKTLIAALLALCVGVATAKAQTPPTSEAAPSAHKLEMARRIIEATGVNTTMTGMMRNMIHQMMAKRIADLPPDRRAQAKVLEDAQADAMDKMLPKIISGMTQQYARIYSEQELSDILVFYESPTGRSLLAKTPLVMQGVTNMMVTDLVPQMLRDMGTEVCAKTACTAEEKAAYFGPPATPAKS